MSGHGPTRTINSTDKLLSVLRANRAGEAAGVYAVCSANRFVLEAAVRQALHDDSLLLIESTSNQVNQFGGYTGQKPADFAQFIREIASRHHFPMERLVLGGDHLGPHVWRKELSKPAMEKAGVLIRDSVLAGYTKIHLDTSMPCADDIHQAHRPLSDEVVCGRAAELCLVAERAHRELGDDAPAPLYVIGTEVPIPGGELSGQHAPEVTRVASLADTLRTAREAFLARGLDEAWERVIAVVVQPGVEFADVSVFPYEPKNTLMLSRYALEHWHGVYEAHSTDYQSLASLRQMVKDHFAILKVGPWLTFAFREAVFALDQIEEEFLAGRAGVQLSKLREELDRAMLDDPGFWKDYYHGDESALRVSRKYSYSDRSRYYWPKPAVAAALDRLLANLTAYPPPDTLLSQFLPRQSAGAREGQISSAPADLIRSKIGEVLSLYATACGNEPETEASC